MMMLFITDPPFLSSLHMENIEDNIPKYVPMDDYFEVLDFSYLFPTGTGGLKPNYTRHMPYQYYQQQLLNMCTHFTKNTEYLFCAQ